MLAIRNCCRSILLLIWIAESIDLTACALQKFIVTPSAVEVSPGKDVILNCRVQNRRGSCSWQKDNKPVGTHPGKYEWAGGEAGGTGGGEDCSIWVRAASLQLDDGLWQCQVTAGAYDTQDALSSPPIPLSVRVAPQPPRLLQGGVPLPPGRQLSTAQGIRSSVLCESRYGNPPASITWFLDDEQLSAWSQTNSSEVERPRVWAARSAVEVVGARSHHGRRLACRASHAAYPDPGYKDAVAVLDVTFAPIASISGADGLDSLEEGNGGALALRCKAEGNPKPSAWWNRSSPRPLPQAAPTDTLLLAPLARNHSGTYTCQARNSIGESDPVSIDIDIKYPARVLWVGPEPSIQATLFTRVSLECRAEGNPTPRYLWTHAPLEATNTDGGMPVGREPILILHNITYRQQGSYRCTASNTIGGRERWHTADHLTLAVVGPPVGENSGDDGIGTTEARLGYDARVTALVCAEPPPRRAAWHWGSLTLTVPAQIGRYRSADPVRQGSCFLYVLHVSMAQRQDARTYLLRVENERGATAHAAHLVIHENAALGPLAAGIVVVIVLVILIFCILRKCRSTKDTNDYSASELDGDKPEGLPADAMYSTRVYSPDALKDAAEQDKENVYSVLDPRVQYDVTISKRGTPPTFLTVSRPLDKDAGAGASTQNNENSFARTRSKRSTRSSAKSQHKTRPKSLQSFDNPKYLDHLFPISAEL